MSMQPIPAPDQPVNPYASSQIEVLGAEPISRPDDTGPFQPFKTIWTRPRYTVRRIVAQDPDLHVLLLASLAGIGEALDNASTRNAGDKISLPIIIALACALGPLGGLFSLYISSFLIRWTGSWMGGVAPSQHIRTAIAWGSVPVVVALPLWIPNLLLVGSDLFTAETPRLDARPALWIPVIAIMVVELVLAIWSLVLLCKTVAEVQGFQSAWRGLGNLILAGLVLFVPLIVIVVGVMAATGQF